MSDELLSRAATGDHGAFTALLAPYRPSIFRHCYRMLGSGADAEDATQDTLERAWLRLESFDGSGSFRGWVHRVATNICLDLLRARNPRRDPWGEGTATDLGAFQGDVDPDGAWVEPVSDTELGRGGDPQDEVIRREDISLAFVAALQRLAPRQRAALLLADVLGFSHAEVGDILDIGSTAVNSLLSRAREVVAVRSTRPRLNQDDPKVRDLLERYERAWRLADIDAFVQLIADDVRFSMPPMVEWFEGRHAVARFVDEIVFSPVRPAGVTLQPGWCNGQPAFATYQPDPGGRLLANGLQLLEVDQGLEDTGDLLITAIVSFRDSNLVARCGLPPHLP